MSLNKIARTFCHGNARPLKRPMCWQECAACHMAFPPGLLPEASWRRILSGLDRHYGSDASMAPAQVQQIGAWVQANAGTYKRVREEPADDAVAGVGILRCRG